jgi:hypothetical protein
VPERTSRSSSPEVLDAERSRPRTREPPRLSRPDGTLYAGDGRRRIQPDRYACPPTPPPEFYLEAWLRTIDEIERREPARLALIHFGIVDDPGPHLDQLRRRLHEWAAEDLPEEDWLRRRKEEREAESDDPGTYERAMPLWQSYAGLRRYWDKLAETGEATIASRNAPT